MTTPEEYRDEWSTPVRLVFEKIEPQPQAQQSLTDQLQELIPVADRLGLYDAADYLRKAVER